MEKGPFFEFQGYGNGLADAIRRLVHFPPYASGNLTLPPFHGSGSILITSRLPMKKSLFHAALIALFSLGSTGCQSRGILGPAPTYHSPRTLAQIEADEAYIDRMEEKARHRRHEDQMASARATEVATRHNPTSVSTSTTTIFPFFW